MRSRLREIAPWSRRSARSVARMNGLEVGEDGAKLIQPEAADTMRCHLSSHVFTDADPGRRGRASEGGYHASPTTL